MPSKELRVGPQTLDEAGELGARLGTYKQAHTIIQKVAAMYPPELNRASILPKDKQRSATLEADELDVAAKDVAGEDAIAVEGTGSVRGNDQTGRFVLFLIRQPSGRTGRAAVAYGAAFSGSQNAYEESLEEEDGGDADTAVESAGEAPEPAPAPEPAAASTGEPYPGYDEATASEIEDWVLDNDPDDAWLREAAAYEAAHKNRKGVMSLLT